MQSPENNPEVPSPSPAQGGVRDLVLNLNFVPSWAKQAPAENPYARHEGESREDRRDDRRDGGGGTGGAFGTTGGGGRRESGRGGPGRGPRRDGPGGPRGPRRDGAPSGDRRGPPGDKRGGFGGGSSQGDRGPRRFEGGPRGGDRDQRGPRGRGPYRDFAPRLPVQVTFVPERNHLGVVVKEIHEKRHAFPLAMLAGLFLQKPENHQIKIEVQAPKGQQTDLKLWQNTKTGMVFLSRESAQAFTVSRDLEEFFERQDIPVDPPTGNFVCVGRCTISGELLGPPNFHGYQDRLIELHRSRFANMPLDVYRSRIEVVRDPAIVEKWKEEAKTIRRYRDKTDPEGPATLKRAEAEFRFLEKYAKDVFKQGNRFLMPGQRGADLPDMSLRNAVRDAWTKENRFPMTLLFALRAAFKHMRLHLFKVGNETFATAIPPKPLDSSVNVVENIQKMLDLLREHPGWTRTQLQEHLLPGVAADAPEVAEAMSPLRWLIDKGHVIEFFNGTLSLPAMPPQRQPRAEKAEAQPAADRPAEAAAETAAPAEAPVAVEAPAVEVAPPVEAVPPAEPAAPVADETAPAV